jgi:hypothetical protein
LNELPSNGGQRGESWQIPAAVHAIPAVVSGVRWTVRLKTEAYPKRPET